MAAVGDEVIRAGVVTYPMSFLAPLGPSWTHVLSRSWLLILWGHFSAWIRLSFGPLFQQCYFCGANVHVQVIDRTWHHGLLLLVLG